MEKDFYIKIIHEANMEYDITKTGRVANFGSILKDFMEAIITFERLSKFVQTFTNIFL